MTESPQDRNILWQASKVSSDERERINGHHGVILWFTGLSAAGKTTIASTVERRLIDKKIHAYSLDGDNIRHGLNSDLGFSKADRSENIRRIGEVAKLFMDSGSIVVASFISPYRDSRDQVRSIVPKGRFIEVFVDCSLEECERRDPKGLYAKARRGEIEHFTGISDVYEPPENPELHLHTDQQSIEECVAEVLSYLKKNITLDDNSMIFDF